MHIKLDPLGGIACDMLVVEMLDTYHELIRRNDAFRDDLDEGALA